MILQIRDYIHVMDLADGHVAALRKLFAADNIGDCIILRINYMHILVLLILHLCFLSKTSI